MVRFPCFATNIHCPKPKKEVLRSPEKMSKAYKDCSQDLKPKVSHVPSLSSPDQMQDKSNPEFNMETSQRASLRKSQSLGSALDREGHVSSGTDSEDNVDQGFSSNHFFENNKTRNFGSLENRDVIQPYHESFEFHVNADPVKTETLSSSDDARQLEEAHEGSSNQLSDEHANESGQSAPGTPPMIAKSYSVPDMGLLSRTSKEGSLSNIHGLPRCRSSQSLDVLDEEREESENHEVHIHVMENRERDCSLFESLTDKCDPSADGYESYVYVNSEKDWTGYGTDDMEMKEHVKESPGQSWNELPSKDFKTKRIEEWVSMIDLEESSKLDEPSEAGISIDKVKKGSHVHGSASTAKLDPKSNHGMEAAKNYITSLTATSTSAQLTNLGLVVIPFLSAFVSLKVLNLSGNGIVRITAGALPRGLHALNLAKNSISTIEGLRELTRLRTLDLSYNRIVRIGHGLASCSSLKELYLTGNKISEVEGLHRLLKLNILDLRFNKISTAKCLGQLAANYSSLQAINLEGNPAQRNVGDEQLKKYLQGLLPHLVYFNKHTIKTNSSKEVSDRPSRDRGLRSEHKLKRKGSLSSATAKASSSSSQAHRSQVVSSTKRSKDRHVRLPPSGTKESHHHRHHFLELSNKLLGLKPDLSMRRSRSEGNLGAS